MNGANVFVSFPLASVESTCTCLGASCEPSMREAKDPQGLKCGLEDEKQYLLEAMNKAKTYSKFTKTNK